VLLATGLAMVLAAPVLAANPPDTGFTLDTPKGVWGITQGDELVFKITVNRGKTFHQNVRLTFQPGQGATHIIVVPREVTVEANNPDTAAHMIVRVPIGAPVGQEPVQVTATPSQGSAIQQTFMIQVKARNR
jgi:uncharacterized membrane protein